MRGVRIFTIGTSGKSVERFFTRLEQAGVRCIVDVRLNNTGAAAGITRGEDLRFLLRRVTGGTYVHRPELAPTAAMLSDRKKVKSAWPAFEAQFLALMEERRVETLLAKDLLDDGCLLATDHEPTHCHRRLVAEYLRRHWANVSITHLL